MRKLDYYEFVAIVIPGSVLLIAAGFLFDLSTSVAWLEPGDFGSLGVHLVVAYVAGHLLQAIGNAVEAVYWRLWGGMPTDWPLTKQNRSKMPGVKDAMRTLVGKDLGDIKAWRFGVARARSAIRASDRGSRIATLNGNYGLYRGLLAAELVLAALVWRSGKPLVIVYGCLAGVVVLTLFRFHRFAVHYARELFAGLSAPARQRKTDKEVP